MKVSISYICAERDDTSFLPNKMLSPGYMTAKSRGPKAVKRSKVQLLAPTWRLTTTHTPVSGLHGQQAQMGHTDR